jgi:hypothetical protein
VRSAGLRPVFLGILGIIFLFAAGLGPKEVWFPGGFRAHLEPYRFLLLCVGMGLIFLPTVWQKSRTALTGVFNGRVRVRVVVFWLLTFLLGGLAGAWVFHGGDQHPPSAPQKLKIRHNPTNVGEVEVELSKLSPNIPSINPYPNTRITSTPSNLLSGASETIEPQSAVGTSQAMSSGPLITAVSGEIRHGGRIVITGTGFGMKSNNSQAIPAAPLIWDTTSEQYVGGTNRNAYGRLKDEDNVNTQIWRLIQNLGGQTARYSTSRPHRNTNVTAHYTANGTKLTLGEPRDPNGGEPPSTQKRFYISFYRKLKNGAGLPGGGDDSTKILRIDSPNLELIGTDFLAHSGLGLKNSDHSAFVASISAGSETGWIRWEVYVDVNKQWFDAWKNGHYHLGRRSGIGSFELRPASDWRFRAGVDSYQYDAPNLSNGSPIWPALFGYDDGHAGVSIGQEIDLGEIYYDNTPARVELSDQATWSDAPTNRLSREVQGRLLTWNNNQISLMLYQGSFASLAGKYLYVIDANGIANSRGFALTVGGSLPAAPSMLTATTISPTRIDLNWTDNATNEGGFKIERKTGQAGSYEEIAVVGAGVNQYSSTGLLSNTAYYHRVRAFNGSGDSPYSDEQVATTFGNTNGCQLVIDWTNQGFAKQIGEFTARFTAKASTQQINAPIGLSDGPASDYTNLAAIVRFFMTGAFDARNGNIYASNNFIPYVAGTEYSFRVPVNVAEHRYSVYVTPAGRSEQVVALNYSFRTEQLGVTELDNLAGFVNGAGSVEVCNFRISSNALPIVSVSAPAEGTTFLAPAIIIVSANAADEDGTISKVEFFQGSTMLGADATAPYTFNWTNVPAGTYSLTAKAIDDKGASSTSAAVLVNVLAGTSSNVTLVISPRGDTYLNLNNVVNALDLLLRTYSWPRNSVANAIVMKFDLSEIPAGSTITGAKLELYLAEADRSTNAIYTIPVHGIVGKNPIISRATGLYYDGTNTWTANSCCYGGAPLAQADISAAYSSLNVDKVLGFKEWDIRALVQQWLDAPETNYGLLLNSDPAQLEDRFRYFASSEHTNASWRPRLRIVYTPAAGVRIFDARMVGSLFRFSFHTETNRMYTVEFSESLNPQSWQPLAGVRGNGDDVMIWDAHRMSPRFYRVKVE